jgi:hypothetical protein
MMVIAQSLLFVLATAAAIGIIVGIAKDLLRK